MPKVQTTSAKNADNRGVVGEVVCVLGAVVSVVVAVLAAGPLCWQHEPFHAQLNPIGGMVGSLPRPPPIGLTCGRKGPRAYGRPIRGRVGPGCWQRCCWNGIVGQWWLKSWQLDPSTGTLNPLMRSETLLVAWWAACPGHHLTG